MKNTLINTRVRSLEEMMADLMATVEQTSLEMREFKDERRDQAEESKKQWQAEMREFKGEWRYQAEESKKEWRDEVREFAERMERDTVKFKESTNEILDRMERENAKFKEDSKRDRRELNKQLGEIANKQGRMTEDLVAPSICRILREVV